MCLFCDINEGKIPSYTLFEDDIVRCILDLNQECLGHMLIIPKIHTIDIETIDKDTLSHCFEIVKVMKKRLEEKLHIDGLSVMQNNGIAQEIKHFHIHLMPKYNAIPEKMEMEELYNILKEG